MADEGPQAPAGWYPDPTVPGQQRYWDGTGWTEHTAPGPGSARPVGGERAPAPTPAAHDGATAVPSGDRPDPWLWQSIVATVLCCLPAGIVAIVYAAQAQGALNSANLPLAHEKADKARTWTLISIGVGIVAGLLWVALAISGVDVWGYRTVP